MNILLTGGSGYIASHTAISLLNAGHQIVLFDNFSNSSQEAICRLEKITGKVLNFVEGDVRNSELLQLTMLSNHIESVIHFAGLKAVSESCDIPLNYFDNNVGGTIALLSAMKACKIKSLVFSSSATVYGVPQYLPLDEHHPTHAVNPYGRSKLHIEEMLTDLALSDNNWQITSLRYFNPVGAHDSGLIGEAPKGIPNNLLPYIVMVASGELPYLHIYGDDYETTDGTGERDYIHIMDLAQGHLAAVNFLKHKTGFHIFNLGTGRSTSVFEMIKAFERVSGKIIPYKIIHRRNGDVASCFANADKAKIQLKWEPRRTLEDMCKSAWDFKNHL